MQVRLLTFAAAAAIGCFWLRRNHRRIRRAKTCMRAITKHPPSGASQKPHVLIFLAGSAQTANVWRQRMELLAAAGYECHALDFVQTGRYFSSMEEQVDRIRRYIERNVQGPPVLIGHGQGGCRAQTYLLAASGDASVDAGSRVRGLVLMASNEASSLASVPDLLMQHVATAGPRRAALAGVLGSLYLDPICFAAGGGPWRERLRLYETLFDTGTAATTLITAQGLADARLPAPAAAADAAGAVPLAAWAMAHLADHEPLLTDLGLVARARTPQQALSAMGASQALGAGGGCRVLHMVAARDRVMPRRQSEKVARAWGVAPTVVEAQAHQFGDAGWEESVISPLLAFLDGLAAPGRVGV